MAWNATVEPILIKDRRVVIMNVSRTALSGIFQPGFTYKEETLSVHTKSMGNDDNCRKEDNATTS
jgi:hypothetical protein